MEQILRMFLLAIVFASIAVIQGQRLYHHAQPSNLRYATTNHHSHQHRQLTGNDFGGLAGIYDYTEGSRNIQQANYGVSDRLVDPVIGYGNGRYRQGYDGYGTYGSQTVGNSNGNALGFDSLLRGYGDVYYGADLA